MDKKQISNMLRMECVQLNATIAALRNDNKSRRPLMKDTQRTTRHLNTFKKEVYLDQLHSALDEIFQKESE